MRDSHALASLGFRPTTRFGGFPYLVTRVVPTMYHVIVVPDDLDGYHLVDIARRQASANALPTCLVSTADSALYIDPDGREHRGEPPKGGVVVTGRLQPCQVFAETPSLAARRVALGRFIEQTTPKKGYMFGDVTKGGRLPTLEERVMLAGRQANGIPRGLTRCGQCREWRGSCLDPGSRSGGLVLDVHCRCDNDNRCAACHRVLHRHRLNGNHYNEVDGQIWHTPGFVAFGHLCRPDVIRSRPDRKAS
ncbi:MAG TPA: hypothetical protein VNN07_02765 [Candidatus Tectomicrobia bacterium]|nr:hypothetical protein [Candidatus Tectomicrobia bacterium]